MADHHQTSAASDHGDINITEPREVNYWTAALGVSEAALRRAVASVGVSAEEIRVSLGMPPSAGRGTTAAGAP
ncbi:hypothetical protein RD110_07600 [Rhodoferax koreense]|uniref:DUF3606 domain-containing protein n=1 Tax=Rhodoferax koreensis TaxID=1842727 RepID=A0A1P8JTJ6_9BURK|nr:DUF3606 domain-containing protein [Rhodoferax koreense]APW37076.1 hypothetical protein RD110_07600 [Rhodoferax koreense]